MESIYLNILGRKGVPGQIAQCVGGDEESLYGIPF
jgi:hypothetical protein